jgi:uncharacterized protein with HEPN domain
MREDDRIRIEHMIDAAESVAQFTAGRQPTDLNTDRMLLFAVVRAIEVIGETAGRISDGVRSQVSPIPWRSIVSMRNRLIHGYFDIDTEIVWKTATDELPSLLPLLRALLDVEPKEE